MIYLVIRIYNVFFFFIKVISYYLYWLDENNVGKINKSYDKENLLICCGL